MHQNAKTLEGLRVNFDFRKWAKYPYVIEFGILRITKGKATKSVVHAVYWSDIRRKCSKSVKVGTVSPFCAIAAFLRRRIFIKIFTKETSKRPRGMNLKRILSTIAKTANEMFPSVDEYTRLHAPMYLSKITTRG